MNKFLWDDTLIWWGGMEEEISYLFLEANWVVGKDSLGEKIQPCLKSFVIIGFNCWLNKMQTNIIAQRVWRLMRSWFWLQTEKFSRCLAFQLVPLVQITTLQREPNANRQYGDTRSFGDPLSPNIKTYFCHSPDDIGDAAVTFPSSTIFIDNQVNTLASVSNGGLVLRG